MASEGVSTNSKKLGRLAPGELATRLAVLLAAAVAACAPAAPAPPRLVPAKPAPRVTVLELPRARPAPLPEWTYWQPVESELHVPALQSPVPPFAEKDVARLGPDAIAWAQQPVALKAQLLRDGMVVVPLSQARTFGELYVRLREMGVPFFVTMDTMFHIAHVAFSRVLAEVEWKTMAPALVALLGGLDARLTAESRHVGSDLEEPYTLARAFVSVARALAVPGYEPPRDIAPAVQAELARIRDHIGPAKSVLFGVTIDYSAFAPQGASDALDPALSGYARAFSWLSAAPFLVASRAEVAGAPANVATSRTHTRAAMLVSRLLVTDADRESRAQYNQLRLARQFMFGHTDDVSPDLLAAHVARAGGVLSDPSSITNVVIVDRVRHSLLTARAPEVFDGVAAKEVDARGGRSRLLARETLSVRFAGDESTQSAALLSALSYPEIGALGWPAEKALPTSARDGARVLPSALDIASWLGSTAARADLHEHGEDAYERYGDAMSFATKRLAADDVATRHATPYASFLDALATYLRAAPADTFEPYARGAPFEKEKLETALSYYATLPHDGLAFTRAPLDTLPELIKNRPQSAPSAMFVEPHPEAIGALLAALAQLRRGLEKLALLPKDGAAEHVLELAEEMLRITFEASIYETNDVTFSLSLAADLANLPTVLAEWEALVNKTADADPTLASDLHTDVSAARVRVLATGPIEAIHVIVREPATGRAVHAVGAHVPVFELVQPAALRLSDRAFRARIAAGSPPPRFSFTDAFRLDSTAAVAPAAGAPGEPRGDRREGIK